MAFRLHHDATRMQASSHCLLLSGSLYFAFTAFRQHVPGKIWQELLFRAQSYQPHAPLATKQVRSTLIVHLIAVLRRFLECVQARIAFVTATVDFQSLFQQLLQTHGTTTYDHVTTTAKQPHASHTLWSSAVRTATSAGGGALRLLPWCANFHHAAAISSCPEGGSLEKMQGR